MPSRIVRDPSAPSDVWYPLDLYLSNGIASDDLPKPDVLDRVTEGRPPSISVSGANGFVAFAFGSVRIEIEDPLYVFAQGDTLWGVLPVCKGEIDSFQKLWVDGVDSTAISSTDLTWWSYTGTAGQVYNSQLNAVDATWTENLQNYAYLIVKLKNVAERWSSWPKFVVEIKGQKLYDPRTAITAYTENAILQLRHILLHAEGKNLPSALLNDASVLVAADVADENPGDGSKRFTGHVVIDQGSIDDWIKVYRLLAHCWIPFNGTQYEILCDRPASVVATLTDDDMLYGFDNGGRGDPFLMPNHVSVIYTDVVNGWVKAAPAEWKSTELLAATEDPVDAVYDMSAFIHDPGIAQRLATYLGNGFRYDFKVPAVFGEVGTSRKVGEVVTATFSRKGITQDFRIIAFAKQKTNTYPALLQQYSATRYSNDTGTDAAKVGSTLPDPNAIPPDVTGVVITEELYQAQDGTYTPRARVTWTNPDYVWRSRTEMYMSVDGGETRYVGPAESPFLLNDLMELSPYVITLRVRSKFGTLSAGVATNFTPVGKTARPSNVPGFFAGADADRVYLYWQPASDADLIGYHIKRGLTTDTWDTAQFVERIGSLNTYDIPPTNGTWRYFIKAFDSAKLESAAAMTVDVDFVRSGIHYPTSGIGQSAAFDAADYTQDGDDLWLGTGNLFAEGVADSHWFFYLSRTTGPSDADTEIAAGSYASIAAWATAVDDPRRDGAPIWAPLPANASGEIIAKKVTATSTLTSKYSNYGPSKAAWTILNRPGSNPYENGLSTGARYRHCSVRFALAATAYSGTEGPDRIAQAGAFVLDLAHSSRRIAEPTALFPKEGLNTHDGSGYPTFAPFGLRLSTNSPVFQEYAYSTFADGVVWQSSATQERPSVKAGKATTDSSGYVVIDLDDYLVDGYIGSTAFLEFKILSDGTGRIPTIVTHNYSSGGDTRNVRVRVVDYTGAGVDGAVISFEVVDAGDGPRITLIGMG